MEGVELKEENVLDRKHGRMLFNSIPATPGDGKRPMRRRRRRKRLFRPPYSIAVLYRVVTIMYHGVHLTFSDCVFSLSITSSPSNIFVFSRSIFFTEYRMPFTSRWPYASIRSGDPSRSKPAKPPGRYFSST